MMPDLPLPHRRWELGWSSIQTVSGLAGLRAACSLASAVSPDPGAITAGPDGALWFAAASGAIGRITTSGQVTVFPLPDARAEVGPLTEGPGAAVWFTQSYGDDDLLNGLIWGVKLGRITV